MGTPTVTTEMMIECIRRELGYRGHVYPRRVAEGKMKQEKADYEILCMAAVLALLQAKLRAEGPTQAALLPENPF